MNDVQTLLVNGKSRLKNCGIESYSIDALLLLTKVLGITKEKLLATQEMQVTEKDILLYDNFLTLRSKKMPIQYILNTCEFMSLDFYVDENVLIPRPDTETLVEKTLQIIKSDISKCDIIELCTGSGCIAVSLAYYEKMCKIIAIDISQKAIDIAEKNATLNCVSDRITFIKSDLFTDIPKKEADIIISNPPYLREDELPTLDESVKNYEPELALNGGSSGLDFYEKITIESKSYLKQNGILIFEIGCTQAEAVTKIMHENKFKNIEVLKDLAGHDRVVKGFNL